MQTPQASNNVMGAGPFYDTPNKSYDINQALDKNVNRPGYRSVPGFQPGMYGRTGRGLQFLQQMQRARLGQNTSPGGSMSSLFPPPPGPQEVGAQPITNQGEAFSGAAGSAGGNGNFPTGANPNIVRGPQYGADQILDLNDLSDPNLSNTDRHYLAGLSYTKNPTSAAAKQNYDNWTAAMGPSGQAGSAGSSGFPTGGPAPMQRLPSYKPMPAPTPAPQKNYFGVVTDPNWKEVQ